MNYLTDFCFYGYLILGAISIIGAVLFINEWIRKKSASYMFKCITFLFIGSAIHQVINAYVRMLKFIDVDAYLCSVNAWWWHSRMLVLIIIYCTIVIVVTRRIYKRGNDNGEE